MCMNCWIEAGSPAIINERTQAAAQAAREVYQFSAVGGACHILIDDWNVDDGNIEFCTVCADNWFANGETETEDQWKAEKKCIEAFRGLNEDERYSALALLDEFIIPKEVVDGDQNNR